MAFWYSWAFSFLLWRLFLRLASPLCSRQRQRQLRLIRGFRHDNPMLDAITLLWILQLMIRLSKSYWMMISCQKIMKPTAGIVWNSMPLVACVSAMDRMRCWCKAWIHRCGRHPFLLLQTKIQMHSFCMPLIPRIWPNIRRPLAILYPARDS